jgi:hypothetical protein
MDRRFWMNRQALLSPAGMRKTVYRKVVGFLAGTVEKQVASTSRLTGRAVSGQGSPSSGDSKRIFSSRSYIQFKYVSKMVIIDNVPFGYWV